MVTQDENALVPVTTSADLVDHTPPKLGTDPQSVRFALDRWAGALSATTLKTYSESLDDFAKSIGLATAEHALSRLLQAGRQAAKLVLLEYQSNMHKARGLAPATVNSRLAAVRSFLGFAEDLGMIGWTMRIKPIKSKSLRDTSGPGTDAVRGMLAAAVDRNDAKGTRDAAIVRLLHDLGLRRKEVLGLDVEHVDLVAGRVSILGKARSEREWITLPPETSKAIEAWITSRGDRPGPLFVGIGNRAKGKRLTGGGLHAIIRKLGRTAAGVRTSPHRLRHTSITTACELETDLHRVQQFSRHASVEMVGIYHDHLEDAGGEVAKLVAASLT